MHSRDTLCRFYLAEVTTISRYQLTCTPMYSPEILCRQLAAAAETAGMVSASMSTMRGSTPPIGKQDRLIGKQARKHAPGEARGLTCGAVVIEATV